MRVDDESGDVEINTPGSMANGEAFEWSEEFFFEAPGSRCELFGFHRFVMIFAPPWFRARGFLMSRVTFVWFDMNHDGSVKLQM